MLRLKLGSHAARAYKENGIAYLPDFIIYDLDEVEYHTFWTNIKNHPRNQLYTNGIQVYKVSWLQSLFQRFKGWLGFDNYCDPNKVEMTLAKIAYHGYLKGYHSPNAHVFTPPIISQRFESLINEKRQNENSCELQQLLMSYYITHSDKIAPWNGPVHQAYPFGQTFNRNELYQLIPGIDPQDHDVIRNAIYGLHYNNYNNRRLTSTDCNKGSRFAINYAEYLVREGLYLEALAWHEPVKFNFLEHYINFYLSEKNILFKALEYATELLENLCNSFRTEDKDKSVVYIKEHFTESEQLAHLKPDSELRKRVAQSYLQDAKTEKSKYTLTKLLFGNNLIPILSHAIKLAPDILNHDHSMQDIVLKEEWITYQFNEAIKEKRVQYARTLFESYPDIKFDKNNLNILKMDYLEELTAKQRKVRTELEQMNCSKAEQTAKEVIELAEQIKKISPLDNPLIKATIDYAGTIIDIDKIKFPDAKDANLEQLDEAQRLLNSCALSNNSPVYKQRFNELLLRKIDCLIEKVRVPIDFNDRLAVRKEFIPTIQSWLDLLHQNLSTFIALNEKNTNNEFRQILGKIYYIKGDLIHFYTRNRQEALPYFKSAQEVMFENPYYRVRYYELTEDEKRHEVRVEIEEMAYLNTASYNMWMTERWNETRYMSEGFDIHSVQPGAMSVFSKISNFFRL